VTPDSTFEGRGCLVTVADDMGKSESVNEAITEAHDSGILTSASIMAGGAAFADAVRLVADRSRLSPGLHVTLCDGKAVLPHSCIPDITDNEGNFMKDPVVAGLHYARPGILGQIEAEIAAQFERLEEAGVHPCHVDCHHHLHMHPFIFEIICRQASRRQIRWIRIPNEPLSIIAAYRSPSRGAMPFIEWAIFGILGKHNNRTARKYKMKSAAHVYGLSRTGNADERYFMNILRSCCKGGPSEIFSHPDTATECGRKELAALISPEVRGLIKELQISPAGYKDFSSPAATIKTKRRCSENLFSDVSCNL